MDFLRLSSNQDRSISLRKTSSPGGRCLRGRGERNQGALETKCQGRMEHQGMVNGGLMVV